MTPGRSRDLRGEEQLGTIFPEWKIQSVHDKNIIVIDKILLVLN